MRKAMSRTIAPYGSWSSPITSALLTSSTITIGQLWVDGTRVYWTENRPLEAGRVAVVCDGADVIPREFNARTRVHEYGGGSHVAHSGVVYFSNFVDQRIYRCDLDSSPRPITPEPSQPAGVRYAD